MLRLKREKEIGMFVWLREHFGLSPELPLGLSQDGEPEPVAPAVTALLWSAFRVAEVVRHNPGATHADVYVGSLKQLRDALTSEATVLTSAARTYADALLVTVERNKELIISVAERFPAVLPEIHSRYSQGTSNPWQFLGDLVAGQSSDLVFDLMNA